MTTISMSHANASHRGAVNAGKLPKILIIGTMKGGTSALFDHVCAHPQFLGGKQKEIHYFTLNAHKGLDWYKSQFDGVPENVDAVDASPSYFDMATSAATASLIKAIIPEPKILLILRDPIERAVSHFSHLQRVNKIPILQGIEPDEFFSQDYTDALTQHSELGWLLHIVIWFSSYSRKYSYYRMVFGDESFMLVQNEHLKNNPERTMKGVFDFIGADYFEGTEFGSFKHSNRSDVSMLSRANFIRLADVLYKDYRKFCDDAGVPFRRLSVPKRDNVAVSKTPATTRFTGDVAIGSDGWLFLAGGTNGPFKYLRGEKKLGPEWAQHWCRLLKRRADYVPNGRHVHLFVPNKETVYSDQTGLPAEQFSNAPLRALDALATPEGRNVLAVTAIDASRFMRKIAAQYQLFWKTDSHWTASGCFAAYQLLCNRLDVSPVEDLLSRDSQASEMALDLGSKLEPPLKETARFYDFIRDSSRVYANEIVQFKERTGRVNDPGSHVGSNVVFENSKARDQRKLVLFGDSFSEYRPVLLTAMLAETFREVHFVWSTSVDPSYVREHKPDILVTEIVERFMPTVPNDTFDLKSYVVSRMAEAD